jgi:hypothetical protein
MSLLLLFAGGSSTNTGIVTADSAFDVDYPQIALRISTDGGRTWGNERLRSTGKVGEYDLEVAWERCGSANGGWMPEIVVTDAVPWRILGAYFEAKKG